MTKMEHERGNHSETDLKRNSEWRFQMRIWLKYNAMRIQTNLKSQNNIVKKIRSAVPQTIVTVNMVTIPSIAIPIQS
jgi:hypothetical protein